MHVENHHFESSKLIHSSQRRNVGSSTSSSSSFAKNGLSVSTFYDPHMTDFSSEPSVSLISINAPQQTQNITETSAKSIVLGGIDGITASYIIVAAAAGASLHWSYFIIIGFSNILANAVSIGVSEFFSSKLHRDFIQAEKRRAMWQYKNFREDEVSEMIRKLAKRGMSREDADIVVRKFALYEDIFVNFLLVEELGMNLPDEDDGASISDALVMLISYAIFGSIPVLVYLLGFKYLSDANELFLVASVVSSIILLVLGSVKSTFSSSYWLHTAAETIFTTSLCAAVAYFLSYFVAEILSEYKE